MTRSRAVFLGLFALSAIVAVGAAILLTRERMPEPSASASAVADRGALVSAFLAEAPLMRAVPSEGPWALSLPRAHGSHPDAPAETWTITAVLEAEDGRRFDLFLTLLRVAFASDGDEGGTQPWALSTLWIGQAVLTTAGGGLSGAEERYARVAGAAGHDEAARAVWLDDWRIAYGRGDAGEQLHLAATVGDVVLDLVLDPGKPALAPEAPDDAAARGFALPRLAVSGSLGAQGAAHAVTGTAWLDRSWGDLPLPGGPIGYDRLVLQMSDGTDLSLVRSRRIGRSGAATLDGVIVGPDGVARVLDDAALALDVDQDEGVLPAGDDSVTWRLTGPDFELSAQAEGGVVRDLLSPTWLGPVTVSGRVGPDTVQGSGLMLLTGEERP